MLRGLSRPRIAALRRAARRGGWGPQGTGVATIAASQGAAAGSGGRPGWRRENGFSFSYTLDGVLIADRVEVKDVVVRGNPGELVEIQGIVTRGLTGNTFEVNGQTVRLTSDTVFEVGKPDNITVDVRIEVEGVFNADGIILAEEVELGTGIEINGTVTRGLGADNTFEVDGQTARLTDDTVFVGGTATDIAIGVPVDVEGFIDEEGVLVATEVDFNP
jgi:hypothetical protein